MFTMESVDRVQKAVTMPVYKNDAHNDVEVSLFKVINIMRSTGLKKIAVSLSQINTFFFGPVLTEYRTRCSSRVNQGYGCL